MKVEELFVIMNVAILKISTYYTMVIYSVYSFKIREFVVFWQPLLYIVFISPGLDHPLINGITGIGIMMLNIADPSGAGSLGFGMTWKSYLFAFKQYLIRRLDGLEWTM